MKAETEKIRERVLSLIRAVREHVFEKTGVMLEPEVEIIKG